MIYADFIRSKAPRAIERGLADIPALADHLFPFQRHCVEFLLRIGSGGLFLDTGLGKTAVQLEWCEHARRAGNGRALILTPLAVAPQMLDTSGILPYRRQGTRKIRSRRCGTNSATQTVRICLRRPEHKCR